MPAHINYETTQIIFYKFVCDEPEVQSCYVGHTTNFNRRRCNHKSICHNIKNKQYNNKIYKTIRENGGWNNWKMIEIDRKICLDKLDACKIEQQYIDDLRANMNTRNTSFDDKTWRSINKLKFVEYMKQYYLNNKNEKIEKKYKTPKFPCECGGKYSYKDKSRHLKTSKHQKYCKTILPFCKSLK